MHGRWIGVAPQCSRHQTSTGQYIRHLNGTGFVYVCGYLGLASAIATVSDMLIQSMSSCADSSLILMLLRPVSARYARSKVC